MQIDILSQNTLKLTLTKLDMFDLDIKYESLSGKNPETKRLLSHVLKSIQFDKRVGFDFSGERLFVEAFPRPDGGCMLYISSLENESFARRQKKYNTERDLKNGQNISRLSSHEKEKDPSHFQICEINDINNLGLVSKKLCWFKKNKGLNFKSVLYNRKEIYRLTISCENPKLAALILREYGEIISGEYELMNTAEQFIMVISEQAAEILAECL
ncbi:MAG: adaptor protein MecA [Eubacterium sp.]|jgi:negative regulator of genetic competence, sporulation and motility|nr:adaptor protein MecA [Eubacterium sp.]